MTLCQLSTRWLDRMFSSCRISIQQQETCSNETDTIHTQFWKISMERQSYGIDRGSKTRRVPHKTTKKLERSYKVNGNSIRNHEEIIWQKIKKLWRTQGWKQYMAEK